MCLNYFKVRDLFRVHTSYSYYECGHCSACLQQKANRRASRIRRHRPSGQTCYFITLSYDNNSIPYILRSDLLSALETFTKDSSLDYISIPIYRDTIIERGFGSSHLRSQVNIISSYKMPRSFSRSEVDLLPGLRFKIGFDRYTFDNSRISVAFLKDGRDFINRFRRLAAYSLGYYSDNSYYFAPEYGPTTCRFHIHYLLWFDSKFDVTFVKDLICSAWPYCSRERLLPFIEVARNAASYTASYVNCDPNVPRILLKEFPLKPSHSTHFGFNLREFEPDVIIKRYRDYRFVFYSTVKFDKTGIPVTIDVPLPSYVLRSTFPLFKGFSRVSLPVLLEIFKDPFNNFALCLHPNYVAKHNLNCEPLYFSNVRDVKGNLISFTVKEFRYWSRRILKYLDLCFSIGLDYFDAAYLLYRFFVTRNSYIYKRSFEISFYPYLNAHEYSSPFYSFPHLDSSQQDLDFVKSSNFDLTDRFYSNLKQRKINSL